MGKRKEPSKKRSGLKRKFFAILLLFAVYLAAGYVEVERKTPLEHLDAAVDTRIFQRSHDRFVRWAGKSSMHAADWFADVLDGLLDRASDIEAPDIRLPDLEMPDVEMPDVKKPLKKLDKTIDKFEEEGHEVIEEKRPSGRTIQRLKDPKDMDDLTEQDRQELDKLIEEKSKKGGAEE